MHQSRRAFLASIAVFGGGCLGSRGSSTLTSAADSDGDGVPDRADDYPNDGSRARQSFRMAGSETLHPGEFSAVALTNSPQASGDVLHYDVAVDGSSEIDCLVFERAMYDAYQNGVRDVSTVSEYSRTGVLETALTRTLDAGEYIFSLDYTDLKTDPGEASVTVSRVLELADSVE